jgi:hypothetical protein
MQDSSPSWDHAGPFVDQVDAELASPSRASQRATHAANCRAASRRRRFVDPTTCQRDDSAAELEFISGDIS